MIDQLNKSETEQCPSPWQVTCCGVMPVLLKVARYRKGVDTEELKRYVAWQLEQYQQQQLGAQIVFIYDFTDAGITNMVRNITASV